MKRFTTAFVLTLFLVATATSRAQAAAHYFGLRGGVNFARVETDDPVELDRLDRAVFGMVGVFSIGGKWLAFQPEILISGKGATGDVPVGVPGIGSLTGKLELDYLEFPMLLRLTVPVFDPLRPFAYGGAALAGSLAARAKVEGGTAVLEDDRIDQFVSDMDFSLMAGAGIGFRMEGVVLELDARYSHGLTSIDATDSGTNPKNRFWGATLAVLFRFGRDR